MSSQFDRLADRWAIIEDEHDKQHPDRGQCGGLGGCAMMRAEHDLERDLMLALDAWRTGDPEDRDRA